MRRRRWRWSRPPAAAPLVHGVVQTLDVHALAPVERAKHLDGVVGLDPSGLGGEAAEALLDVLARDGVEGPLEPRRQILVDGAAVGGDRAGLPLGTGAEILLEGLAQGGHGARPRALCRGILAGGDAPEHLVRHAPGLVRGDDSETPEDDAPVGCLAPAGAGAVVEDEGSGSRRHDADAEAGERVVPCDVGFFGGLQGVDGALCDVGLSACGPLAGVC